MKAKNIAEAVEAYRRYERLQSIIACLDRTSRAEDVYLCTADVHPYEYRFKLSRAGLESLMQAEKETLEKELEDLGVEV